MQEELHVEQAVQDIVRLIKQDARTALLIVQLLRRYQLERNQVRWSGKLLDFRGSGGKRLDIFRLCPRLSLARILAARAAGEDGSRLACARVPKNRFSFTDLRHAGALAFPYSLRLSCLLVTTAT